MIKVQKDDFDLGQEMEALQRHNSGTGAIVTCVGLVKDQKEANEIAKLPMDYPLDSANLTIKRIVQQAKNQWSLNIVRVILRVGKLSPGDRSVFVGVTSGNQQEAMMACQHIVDAVKALRKGYQPQKGSWDEGSKLAVESC